MPLQPQSPSSAQSAVMSNKRLPAAQHSIRQPLGVVMSMRKRGVGWGRTKEMCGGGYFRITLPHPLHNSNCSSQPAILPPIPPVVPSTARNPLSTRHHSTLPHYSPAVGRVFSPPPPHHPADTFSLRVHTPIPPIAAWQLHQPYLGGGDRNFSPHHPIPNPHRAPLD